MKFLLPIFLVLCVGFAHNVVAQDNSNTWYQAVTEHSLMAVEVQAAQVDQLLVIEDVSPGLSLEGRKPLLLIHGWSFDGKPAPPGGGYWEHFKNYLLNDPLLSANFKPYYVKYWSNDVSVKDLATELRRQVEAIGFHEQKIAILAHSMGGLVARSYLNESVFSKGIAQGKKCGDMVDVLITLGTPHHGSPMANNKARNAKFTFPLSLYVTLVETAFFKEIKYNEYNRSDLRWDNYDNLLDYNANPDEKNDWLVALNQFTQFDAKTVCYTASVTGVYKTNPGTLEEQYQLGAYLIEQGFKLPNDGIVPIKSAAFEGHTVRKIRHFNNYNHADIIRGKDANRTELFDPLKTDLMEFAPLKISTEAFLAKSYIKHSQTRIITWDAPALVQHVNIYFSSNNGQSFQKIANRIPATDKQFAWLVPDINVDQCLLKITNADFESEMHQSPVPFTIFHNRIVVTTPSNGNYMMPDKINTIAWTQEGLGKMVKITYRDLEKGTSKVIAASLSTVVGNNTFSWPGDTTLLPTDKGVVEIQLLNLLEDFGDTEIYTFKSSEFSYLGERGFNLLSPLANQTDFFGVEGEQLEVGSLYVIDWKAMGEVKFVEFFVCDSNKQVISSIGTDINAPKVISNRSTRWYVPELYGNKFYLLARAGLDANNIFFEVYSDNTFRINKSVNFVNVPPLNAFPLQACFEIENMEGATAYQFFLQSGNDTNYFWEFESSVNMACLPKSLDFELTPGAGYTITAVALLGDTLHTFVDQLSFTAIETAPSVFEIISPVTDTQFEEHQITVSWNRAVGTASYSIELLQGNQTVFAQSNLTPADTVLNIDITDVNYYEDIAMTVSAHNAFGSSSVITVFSKKFRNSVDVLSKNNNPFNLKIYPNPITETAVVSFVMPEHENKVVVEMFDITGRKVASLYEGVLTKGEQQVTINRNSINIRKGLYLVKISSHQLNAQSFILFE